MEIVQHEQRLKRFRPETLALVVRAQQSAAAKLMTAYDLDETKRSFDKHLQDLNGEAPSC